METSTTDRRGIPEALARLRAKLNQKAKQEPTFSFYTLYGHLVRDDVMETAWKQVKRNKGAAGIDGITIKDIEKSEGGVKAYIEGIKAELVHHRYQAAPLKRVYIPKSNGQMRPLGIPTVKDRVIQAALLLVIEPIYEADFQKCSYGFRPEKSAHEAIEEIRTQIRSGRRQVYDGDLQSFFDTIPHDKLMKAVQMRISDTRVLKLIRMWMSAPVWEPGKPMQSTKSGTPQGGVISPLLANVYLNWFDKIFYRPEGPGTWAKAALIRYADDFVILAKYLSPRIVKWVENEIEGRFGLKINREKTRVIDVNQPKTEVNFLGYVFRWVNIRKESNRKYCQHHASKKALIKARERIRELTDPRLGCKPVKEIVKRLNLFLRGWGQYFCKGVPSKTFSAVNWYAETRLRQFLMRRSQRGYKQYRDDGNWYAHFKKLGLVLLKKSAFM
jgi:RNA-directed DNA polymerase